MSFMPKNTLISKKERTARLIYYSKLLRDAIEANDRLPNNETFVQLDEALCNFLDSVEIYEHGELDLTNRGAIFELQI